MTTPTQSLISMMSSFTLLDALRDDYKTRLSLHVVEDPYTKLRLVPNRKVAEFFNSDERKAMDKQYRDQQINRLQVRGSSEDGYKDHKGRI